MRNLVVAAALSLVLVAACKGDAGPVGPEGPAGATGDSGAMGERGIPGQDGSAVRVWSAYGVVPQGNLASVPLPRDVAPFALRPPAIHCFTAWPNSNNLPFDGVWSPIAFIPPDDRVPHCWAQWIGDFYIVHVKQQAGWLFAVVALY